MLPTTTTPLTTNTTRGSSQSHGCDPSNKTFHLPLLLLDSLRRGVQDLLCALTGMLKTFGCLYCFFKQAISNTIATPKTSCAAAPFKGSKDRHSRGMYPGVPVNPSHTSSISARNRLGSVREKHGGQSTNELTNEEHVARVHPEPDFRFRGCMFGAI